MVKVLEVLVLITGIEACIAVGVLLFRLLWG